MNIMKKTEFFKRFNAGTLWLATALLIGFSACNNDETLTDTDLLVEETESFEDEQDTQEGLDDVSDVFDVLTLAQINEGGRVLESDTLPPDSSYVCAEIIHNRREKTIIINFGDGCIGLDGVLRSGQIIITYTGHFLLPGSVITKTFRNYFVNNHKVEGFITLTNISPTLESFPTFSLVLEGGKFTWKDGTFALRESDFVWTWVNSNNPLNDEYHKDGNARGLTRRGVEYGVEITSTLIRKRICKLEGVHIPVQGIKFVTREGYPNFTVDYGDGECDNTVIITREDGKTRVVENFRRFHKRNRD
jgi:hypothetical protein